MMTFKHFFNFRFALPNTPIRIAWLLVFCYVLASCSSGGSGGDSTSNNCGVSDCSPRAWVAVPSITAYAGQTVMLDGSSSTPNGMLTYRWEQLSGPDIEIEGANNPVASITIPTFETDQALVFRLVVSKGNQDGVAQIGVTVKPLKVEATASATTASVGDTVFLRASEGDGSGEQRYLWEQIDNSGLELAIDGADSANAKFSPRVVIDPAIVRFRVTLTNKYGATAISEVSVNLESGVIPSISAITPSATSAGEEVKVSGAGFTDAHGLMLESDGVATEIEYQAISDHEIRFLAPNIKIGDYKLKIANSGGDAAANITLGSPFKDAVHLSQGTTHACAIKSDKSLWCWGENDYGQLGNSSQTDSLTPVAVLDANKNTVNNAVAIAAAEVSTCVLRDDGKVYCWGNNSNGQLGDGTKNSHSNLVAVVGLPGAVRAIAAGSYFSCALLEVGDVYCWGANDAGQLGNAPSPALGAVKIGDTEMPKIISIDLGDNHVCGIVEGDRSIVCWGGNEDGQLGDGTFIPRTLPVNVKLEGRSMTGVSMVALGSRYSCALLNDGRIACWGNNEFGQLGNGSKLNSVYPSFVSNSQNLFFRSIYTGHSHDGMIGFGRHTCAESSTSVWYCWGQNNSGQLGTGDTAYKARPTEVANLDGAKEVSLGTSGGCATFVDGNLRCWGQSGARFDRSKSGAGPYAVTVENLNNVVAISSGGIGRIDDSFSCALSITGVVSCWGHNDQGQLGVGTVQDSAIPAPVSLPNVSAISSGGSHSCAVSSGQVYCWGSNTDKYSIYPGILKRTMKLGSDSVDQSPTPILVSGISDIESVAVGAEHSCALSNSGDVYCWGDSAAGIAGVSAVPTRVARLPARAIQIAAGAIDSCALLVSGDVYCWRSSDPVRISIPSEVQVLNIAVGGNQSCASAAGGSVYCWGGNEQGQLGNGSLLASNYPVKVIGINNALNVAASGVGIFYYVYSFSCALQSHYNGSVSCWGSNFVDQLGDGSGVDQSTPVSIPGLHGIKQIASGGTHSCALYHDGYVACWGGLFSGQLGQAPLAPRAVLQ